MAIQLDIKSELPKAIKWTDLHTKQLPFSISQAMNASVKGLAAIPGSKQKSALNALAGASRRYLDQPKPQTQTGFFATTAKKRSLVIEIRPKTKFLGKDGGEKGWDRTRYLMGNIDGGKRAPKPYEIVFAANASDKSVPIGSFFVPTRFQKRDRYGNISKSNLNKIINSFGTGSRSGSNIFVGTPKGGNRQAGVYRRERGYTIRPLFFLETAAPSYQAIFPARQQAMAKIQTTFGLYLRDRLARNVAAELKRGSF
jgi:hypothetical protein